MRRGAIVAACVLAVVLAYRGGGSSRTAVSETACLDAATVTAAVRAAVSTPDPHERWSYLLADNEAQCRLRRALLTKVDVGADDGSATDVSHFDHMNGSSVVDCRTPMPEPVAGLRSDVADVRGRAFDSLGQYVYAFPPGGAADLMLALRRNCTLLASGTSDEQRQAQMADIPRLGDDSIAIRNSFGSARTGTVYVRRGDLVAAVIVGADSNMDAALTEAGQLAAEKLGRVGPMPEPTYVTGEGCVPAPTPSAAVVDALSGGMLTLDDMPVGWVHDPPGPCGRIDEEGDCKNAGDTPPEPLSITTTGFRGGREDYVANRVEVYAGHDARTLIDGIRSALPAECLASIDGRSYGKHWDPIDVPNFGDGAVGLHLTTRGLATEASYYVILIRRGRAISTVAFQPGHFPWPRVKTIPLDFALMASRADSRLASIQDKLPAD